LEEIKNSKNDDFDDKENININMKYRMDLKYPSAFDIIKNCKK
jgi:hypothetical protein